MTSALPRVGRQPLITKWIAVFIVRCMFSHVIVMQSFLPIRLCYIFDQRRKASIEHKTETMIGFSTGNILFALWSIITAGILLKTDENAQFVRSFTARWNSYQITCVNGLFSVLLWKGKCHSKTKCHFINAIISMYRVMTAINKATNFLDGIAGKR